MERKISGPIAMLAAVLAAGCAYGIPAPTNQYAAAGGAIARAQVGGAPSHPEARLHLQLAREDLGLAKHLMGDDNARALSLTAVAASEADLALALARQAQARSQAQSAQDDLQKIVGPH